MGNDLKICKGCLQELPLCDFNNSKHGKNGKYSKCKRCVKEYYSNYSKTHKNIMKRKWAKAYNKNKNDPERKRKKRDYDKRYIIRNINKLKSKRKIEWQSRKSDPVYMEIERGRLRAYAKAHKKERSEYRKAYREKNHGTIKKYHDSRKPLKKVYDKAYRAKNRDRINSQLRHRRAIDPLFKLRCFMSSRISTALKKQGGSKRGNSIFSKLGYSFDELKKHLEKKFDAIMSWNNYGSYWVVDHIIPKVAFVYSSMDDKSFKDCWSLSNLQPLKIEDNLKKNSFLGGVRLNSKKLQRPTPMKSLNNNLVPGKNSPKKT